MQKPLHKRRELIITLYVQIQWGEKKKYSSVIGEKNISFHHNQSNKMCTETNKIYCPTSTSLVYVCIFLHIHVNSWGRVEGGNWSFFFIFFFQRLFNHDHYIVNGQPKNNIKKTAWKRNGRIDVKEEREVDNNNNKTEAKMCSDLPTPFLKIQKNKPPAWIEFNKESSWAKNCTCSTGIGTVPPQPVVYKQHVQESLPPLPAQALHHQYRFQQRPIQFNHTTATGSAMGIRSLLLLGAI